MELVNDYIKTQVSNLLIELYLEDDRKEDINNLTSITAFQYLIYWNRIPDCLSNKITTLLDGSNDVSAIEIQKKLVALR